jgi:uncharacterized protein (TIGR02266 family)
MTTIDERRRHTRIAVEMHVDEQHEKARYFQRSGNLSAGGIWLDGTLPHPRGTIVELRFTLPGETAPIELRGEVVGDVDPERLGMHVRFVDLDARPEVAQRIAAFVGERAKRITGNPEAS